MSARDVEALLARLLADPAARERFLSDPLPEARRAGLTEDEAQAFAFLDPDELGLAGFSFDSKRRRSWLGR